MRRLMLFSGIMLAVSVHVRALGWSTFSINQNPVPANAVVSFSIGYPQGWKVMQTGWWCEDIYFDHAVPPAPTEMVCAFSQPSSANPTNLTMFAIFDSHGRPAKDAAESFARNMKDCTLSPVKTAAGDSGWLLESRCDFKIWGPISESELNELKRGGLSVRLIPASATSTVEKIIEQQYFFHSGSKGSIRVQIMTPAWDSVLRARLDQLVLQTLRFGGS
jgi:hypothetical protein